MFRIAILIFLSTSNYLQAQTLSNPCLKNDTFHIVILGSSTAAGAGASVSDSAWVNRYRKHLKGFNSENQVTNLAVGGYNTYKLMPNGFNPPPNRPLPDTLKNISKAIELSPDAIIVNLPSNDVAAGFSLAEQISNFDTMVARAELAGIPIWICTTQPRNFSATQQQLQSDMKDSIFARYAPNVLDFWTGLALPNNSIDPVYNSGDGVHLNDAGHRLLFIRAAKGDILGTLSPKDSATDISIESIDLRKPYKCKDTKVDMIIEIGSLSIPDSSSGWLNYGIYKNGQGLIVNDSLGLFNDLSSCSIRKIMISDSINGPGTYTIKAGIKISSDSNPANDSLEYVFDIVGTPPIVTRDDTLCDNGNAELKAFTGLPDSIFWYDHPSSGNLIASGNSLFLNNVDTTLTYYARAVRGDLFYRESLTASRISNVNWNGTMFDIIASDTLTLDSISLKLWDSTAQIVEMRIRNGSFSGFELDSATWLFYCSSPVSAYNGSDLRTMLIPPLELLPGDTLAIYLQMANPNARLSYQNVPAPVLRQGNALSVRTGAGISHDFGALFFPRDWSGTLHYHYGFKPLGECATEALKVSVKYSDTGIDLGMDTSLYISESLNFDLGSGFHDIVWSDGNNSSIRIINASTLGIGSHFISVQGKDYLNCLRSDSIMINVLISGLNNSELINTRVYPNPSKDKLFVDYKGSQPLKYEFMDINGRKIEEGSLINNFIDLNEFSPGTYLLKLVYGNDFDEFRIQIMP